MKNHLINTLKILLLCLILLGVVIAMAFGYRDIPVEELKAKYALEPSSFVEVGGMEVHYREEGDTVDAVPIVLIHGTGSSLHTFDPWVVRLKQDYRIIRMDLPGYGLTGPFPHRDYTIEAYVDFINQFLDTLGVEKCIIGGNSLGGQISWQFTAKFPDKVQKLILINAAGYPAESKRTPLAFQLAKIPVVKQILTFITPRHIAKSSIQNVYADKRKVTDELVNRYFELTLRPGNRQAFIDRFSAKRNPEAYKHISGITQPTLILWGDQDQLIPVKNATRFQKDLPNDTLVILENVGHVPMEESPDLSVQPVLKFLESDSHL